jgi:hypothetical protein
MGTYFTIPLFWLCNKTTFIDGFWRFKDASHKEILVYKIKTIIFIRAVEFSAGNQELWL